MTDKDGPLVCHDCGGQPARKEGDYRFICPCGETVVRYREED